MQSISSRQNIQMQINDFCIYFFDLSLKNELIYQTHVQAGQAGTIDYNSITQQPIETGRLAGRPNAKSGPASRPNAESGPASWSAEC